MLELLKLEKMSFGDSGGPLFREIDKKLTLVGVVSQGMNRICAPMGTRFTVFGPEVLKIMENLGILKKNN